MMHNYNKSLLSKTSPDIVVISVCQLKEWFSSVVTVKKNSKRNKQLLGVANMF